MAHAKRMLFSGTCFPVSVNAHKVPLRLAPKDAILQPADPIVHQDTLRADEQRMRLAVNWWSVRLNFLKKK